MYEYMMWISLSVAVVCILWAIRLAFQLHRVNRAIKQGDANIARLKRAIDRYDDVQQ